MKWILYEMNRPSLVKACFGKKLTRVTFSNRFAREEKNVVLIASLLDVIHFKWNLNTTGSGVEKTVWLCCCSCSLVVLLVEKGKSNFFYVAKICLLTKKFLLKRAKIFLLAQRIYRALEPWCYMHDTLHTTHTHRFHSVLNLLL